MTRRGVDFSGARPTAATLVNAGIECVLFYVGPQGDWRMPPRSLIDSYIAAGIECAAIYEEGDGSFALKGYDVGVAVGRRARQYLDAYGWGGPAFVATDIDIAPAQLDRAVDAYRGVRDGAGREMGVYGGGLLVEGVRTRLGWRLLWRANASSWHHGVAPVGLVAQQHLGPAPGVPDTDANTVFVDKGGYWGQWAPGAVTPQPSQPKDDDMAYSQWSDADKAAFWHDFLYHLSGASKVQGNLPGGADPSWSSVGDVMVQLTSDEPDHIRRAVNDIYRKTVDPGS